MARFTSKHADGWGVNYQAEHAEEQLLGGRSHHFTTLTEMGFMRALTLTFLCFRWGSESESVLTFYVFINPFFYFYVFLGVVPVSL